MEILINKKGYAASLNEIQKFGFHGVFLTKISNKIGNKAWKNIYIEKNGNNTHIENQLLSCLTLAFDLKIWKHKYKMLIYKALTFKDIKENFLDLWD